MKIFFTDDKSVDENLEQVCPFGELHHFHRNDGSEFTMPKYVGCGGCLECKYCYGSGFRGYYHTKGKHVLTPVTKHSDSWSDDYDVEERKKQALGLDQFRMLDDQQYIMCAKCFDDKWVEEHFSIRFKIWWWHHVGNKWDDIRYNLDKFRAQFPYKAKAWIRKIFNKEEV